MHDLESSDVIVNKDSSLKATTLKARDQGQNSQNQGQHQGHNSHGQGQDQGLDSLGQRQDQSQGQHHYLKVTQIMKQRLLDCGSQMLD